MIFASRWEKTVTSLESSALYQCIISNNGYDYNLCLFANLSLSFAFSLHPLTRTHARCPRRGVHADSPSCHTGSLSTGLSYTTVPPLTSAPPLAPSVLTNNIDAHRHTQTFQEEMRGRRMGQQQLRGLKQRLENQTCDQRADKLSINHD